MFCLFFIGGICHLVVSQTLYEPNVAKNTLLNDGVQTTVDTLFKWEVVMILSSMLMTPSLYTVCKTRNPNGTAMLYQLSLLVWGEKWPFLCCPCFSQKPEYPAPRSFFIFKCLARIIS